MLKKTITYTDYNGNERTEDFYFNLSKAEIVEMEMSISGGLTQMINKIVAEQNNPELFKLFKDLIMKSYGEKSLDGKRFVKSVEISTNFTQTEAYSVLLEEFMSNASTAAAFVNGIIPKVDTTTAQITSPITK